MSVVVARSLPVTQLMLQKESEHSFCLMQSFSSVLVRTAVINHLILVVPDMLNKGEIQTQEKGNDPVLFFGTRKE